MESWAQKDKANDHSYPWDGPLKSNLILNPEKHHLLLPICHLLQSKGFILIGAWKNQIGYSYCITLKLTLCYLSWKRKKHEKYTFDAFEWSLPILQRLAYEYFECFGYLSDSFIG